MSASTSNSRRVPPRTPLPSRESDGEQSEPGEGEHHQLAHTLPEHGHPAYPIPLARPRPVSPRLLDRRRLSASLAAVYAADSPRLPPSPSLDQVIDIVNDNSARVQALSAPRATITVPGFPVAQRQHRLPAAPLLPPDRTEIHRSGSRSGQQRRAALVLDSPLAAAGPVLLPARSVRLQHRAADRARRARVADRSIRRGHDRPDRPDRRAVSGRRRPRGDSHAHELRYRTDLAHRDRRRLDRHRGRRSRLRRAGSPAGLGRHVQARA